MVVMCPARSKFLSPRRSSPKKRSSPEADIQKQIVNRLMIEERIGRLIFWHTPNGAKLSMASASHFKALGMKAGVPDLIIVADGNIYFVEVKAEKGRLSDSQEQFLERMYQQGHFTAVVKSYQDAIEIFKEWGLING